MHWKEAELQYFEGPLYFIFNIVFPASSSQHRCVAIFKDKQNKPTGFALGSIEGRVAIHYINPQNP